MNGNGTALHRELQDTVTRWPLAAGAKVNQFARQRLDTATTVESRRLIATAQCELAQRALLRFCGLLYEPRGDAFWNIADDGRILIACPWSRTQHGAYGLTDHGGRILRSLVVARLAGMPFKYQWLVLKGRFWYVNQARFPDLASAEAWLAEYGPTPQLWQKHADALPRRGQK